MQFKADYDVFLSHNSKDKPIVEALAVKLTQAGLQTFLDKWCLIPGEPWQDELEEALLRSASCAVCIGDDSLGPWAHEEMRAALSLAVGKRSTRVIPVLLPGASPEVLKTLPLFLQNRTWVDLRDGVEDEQGIKRLLAGIFGRKPREFSAKPSLRAASEMRLDPRISQALPQAADYQDRAELAAIREFWINESYGGVFALVGIGGSGKTALVSRFLQELPSSGVSHDAVPKRPDLPTASALFVWSFYDFPDVDQFISYLLEYLLPDEKMDGNTSDKALRLMQTLETSPYARVLIVLDGLEMVQEGKEAERVFGLLRDSSLRHLLRRLCQGIRGVKTIITTRFPIPDLLADKSAGYIQRDTDQLDLASARQLLLSRGVRGSDKDIQDLVRQFGSHALTLDHLGIVLKDFFNGDVKKAATLMPLQETSSDARSDYQAYRLARLFRFYQQRLRPSELELLKSLCVFRLPVELEVLVRVVSGQEQHKRKGTKADETSTRAAILSLNTRRLVTIRAERDKRWCNVHPSIREYFYASLGKKANVLHAQATKVFLSLAERPERSRERTDPAEIDAIGELIYHTLRSGDLPGAEGYYRDLVKGYEHLGWSLGAFDRGYRITRHFNDYAVWSPSPRGAKYILNDHALFMLDLGRTEDARSLLQRVIEIDDGPSGYPNFGGAYQAVLRSNLCDALIVSGRLPEAEALASALCNPPPEADSDYRSKDYDYWSYWIYPRGPRQYGFNPFARRASARALRGDIDAALSDYEEASFGDYQSPGRNKHKRHVAAIRGQSAVDHALLLMRIGATQGARDVLRRCQAWCLTDARSARKVAWLLAQAEVFRIFGHIEQSARLAEQSLAWTIETGHQELYCRSQLLIAKLRQAGGQLIAAQEASSEACRTSCECGFGIHLVDALVVSAWISLQRQDYVNALASARDATDRASDRFCDYRWGVADSVYVEANCLLAQGNKKDALHRFEFVTESRRDLRDPRLAQTERLVATAKR
jgi:tetratricopeptide (TPR) repeat protein